MKVKTVCPAPSIRERVWELLFSDKEESATTGPYSERAAVSALAASSRQEPAGIPTAGMAFSALPTFRPQPSSRIGAPERLYSSTYSASGNDTAGEGLYITSLMTTESGCAETNTGTVAVKTAQTTNRAQ